ncbi:acyltransferase [Sporosarcina sp. Marseille-Q4943]|uniref:acyltransferase n=1 Tax=Sporosarcina sp. Marseille-Q4943 TaxID=2942204 RepID=UPI00208DCB05|nr:acyltransferase [Sporosarcina sp. Marseille-Q4943]
MLKKLRRLIRFIEFISKFVPKPLFVFLWRFSDSSESKVALLIRYLYVKKYSNDCGENIYIGKGVILKNIEHLTLGSNISIHAYNYIDAAGGITIGDNVSIANQSSLISFEHTWEEDNIPIKYNKVKKERIVIQNDIWIGTGCRILSNVTLYRRSIVAAGAVVNKDVLPNTIVGGIPARKIKDIY